MADNGT